MSIPLPLNDQERIERLLQLCPDLLSERTDVALQGVVELAAMVCATPTALVTFVGEDTQYFRAQTGMAGSSTPREVSFCTWAILDDEPFIVPDATIDDRFSSNPLVTGDPHIRFYAGIPLVTSDGRFPLGTICVIDDRPRELDTAQLEILSALASTVINIVEQQYEMAGAALRTGNMLDSIGDCVIATDDGGIVSYANPATVELLGDSMVGQPIAHVMRLEHEGIPLDPHPIHAAINQQEKVTLPKDIHLQVIDGAVIEVDDCAAPTFDMRGELTGAIMVFRNVTEERTLARDLHWHGTHDALTGLANRSAFEQELAARLDSSNLDTRSGAVLYIDLDRFKGVNDQLGHGVGDQLLTQIAFALESVVGDSGSVARIGGDEFAVLLATGDSATARSIGLEILGGLRALGAGFADQRANIGASIGLVTLDDPNLTVAEVFHRSDSACYAAKHAGGGRVQVYDPELAEIESWNDGVRWMSRLQTAIEEDRLLLYAQPILPLDDSLPSIEILVRLVEDGEVIRPGTFMAAAERFRLARTLDRWVVQNTLATLHAAGTAVEQFSAVHINLSGQSLGDADMASDIRHMIEESGVRPDALCFEITESNAVAELWRATSFIDELTSIGCTFALDDFGRGFSSFDYLRRFNVGVVKIDGSFVHGIHDDLVSHKMLEAIVSVCGTLGKRTIAEWVDSDETIQLLRELDVDAAQGNFLGEPVPIESLLTAR